MEQRTPEWHALRKSKIGSSDAPVIMGVSPWKTEYMLWAEKIGLNLTPRPKSKLPNPLIQRGLDLESKALASFCKEYKFNMSPNVHLSVQYPWMMASTDGFDLTKGMAVEIKCPGEKDHELALKGIIPEKYIPQLDHILIVLDIRFIYYYSFDGVHGQAIKHTRDHERSNILVEKERLFYDRILDLEPPELTEKDFVERDDQEWLLLAQLYKDAIEQEEKAIDYKQEIKAKLIELTEGYSTIGGGIKLSKIARKGAVDYKAIPELKNVNVNQYRKEYSECWRITC